MTKTIIDKAYALRWCNHNEAHFERVLTTFYQRYHDVSWSSLSPADVRRIAHDLKNLAPACGAPQLADYAASLTLPAPLPTAQQQDTLRQHLHTTLQAIADQYPQLVYTGQQYDTSTTQKLYNELIQQLDQHNLKSLSLFEQWVSSYISEAMAPQPQIDVTAIREVLQRFHFPHAKQMIQAAVRSTSGDTIKS